MLKTLSTALAVSFVSVGALAGQVVPAEMTGSVLTQVSSGNLDGCGLRIVASAQDQSMDMTAVDFSFNLYRSGVVMVKARARLARMNVPSEVQTPLIRPIAKFWVRAAGKQAITPTIAGIFKSDSPKGDMLFRAHANAVAPLFVAALKHRQIQVGVRFEGEATENIYSGTVQRRGGELDELSRCLTKLAGVMSNDVAVAQAKGE